MHNFIRASGEPGFGRLRNFDSADGGQNFTRASDGRNFISAGRARNFSFINDFSFLNAARNFTLALAAICILGGCDGGSDGQDREQSARSEQNFSASNQGRNSAQNSVPQGLESKQKSDLNSTIDELANDAKVFGEALQNLQKKAPEVLSDFAARNADRIEDLLK